MSERLQFGDFETIKRLKKEARALEQAIEWEQIVSKAAAAVKAGSNEAKEVASASIFGDWNCGSCLRVDCECSQEFADFAPNGAIGYEPDFDFDVCCDSVSITCLDRVVK